MVARQAVARVLEVQNSPVLVRDLVRGAFLLPRVKVAHGQLTHSSQRAELQFEATGLVRRNRSDQRPLFQNAKYSLQIHMEHVFHNVSIQTCCCRLTLVDVPCCAI